MQGTDFLHRQCATVIPIDDAVTATHSAVYFILESIDHGDLDGEKKREK